MDHSGGKSGDSRAAFDPSDEMLHPVADIGVVFIHGIGKQERGSTLRAGAECVGRAACEVRLVSRSEPSDLDQPWADVIDVKASDETALRVLLVDGWWDDTVAVGPS